MISGFLCSRTMKVDNLNLMHFSQIIFCVNKLILVGANPVWDPDSEPSAPKNAYLTDLDLKNGKVNSLYRKDDDDIGSLSSGDSVLIGVENQAEFRGYKDMVRDVLRNQTLAKFSSLTHHFWSVKIILAVFDEMGKG